MMTQEINPRTGKLETSFKSFEDLQRDQTDRAGTILSGQRGVRTRGTYSL